MRCEYKTVHPISDHHLVIEDKVLFRKVMYFCSWNCLRHWMTENNFPIKKEKLFAIDIGSTDVKLKELYKN